MLKYSFKQPKMVFERVYKFFYLGMGLGENYLGRPTTFNKNIGHKCLLQNFVVDTMMITLQQLKIALHPGWSGFLYGVQNMNSSCLIIMWAGTYFWVACEA